MVDLITFASFSTSSRLMATKQKLSWDQFQKESGAGSGRDFLPTASAGEGSSFFHSFIAWLDSFLCVCHSAADDPRRSFQRRSSYGNECKECDSAFLVLISPVLALFVCFV